MSLKDDWELLEIKNYFIHVGNEKFREENKFYDAMVNDDNLIKEQLSLEFLKIFNNEWQDSEYYLDLNNQVRKAIVNKCQNFLTFGNPLFVENLNYLLKDEMLFLNNVNLQNTNKRKKEIKDMQVKVKKKMKKENIKDDIKKDYNLKIINENLEQLKQKKDQKIAQFKKIKTETENEDNIFCNIKEINEYLFLVDNYIINWDMDLENSEIFNIEQVNDSIKFNNEIIKKMTEVDTVLSDTLNLFKEDGFFKNPEFVSETRFALYLLNKEKFVQLRKNNLYFLKIKDEIKTNNLILPPPISILKFDEELLVLKEIETIDRKLEKLQSEKEKLEMAKAVEEKRLSLVSKLKVVSQESEFDEQEETDIKSFNVHKLNNSEKKKMLKCPSI